jgi:hypothetical protein
VANNEIDNNKKCKQIAGNFESHANAAVRCEVHCLMEHIPDFTRSHWMPPSGKCLHRIAPAAAKVINFGCKYKLLTKQNF